MSDRRTATIQATGKKWKAMQALGGLALLTGVTVLIMGLAMRDGSRELEDATVAAVGILVLLAGLPAYLLGRMGAWWFHG